METNSKKVLIIDFDAESLYSLSSLLREEGFAVETARDGLAGLAKFRSDRPDLVILEAMLPKLNGFELCKKIVADTRGRTPVIMLTGVYKDVTSQVEALQIYGASAFFTKPWDTEELRTKLLSLLGIAAQEPVSRKNGRPPRPITDPLKPKDDDLDRELEEAFSELEAFDRKKYQEKKVEIEQEVDLLLKDTLTGLGMNHKEKRIHSSPPPKSEPAVGIAPTWPQAPRPQPSTYTPKAPFEEYTVKKRKPVLLFACSAAVVLIAGALSFSLLKPNKNSLPPPAAISSITLPQTPAVPPESSPSAKTEPMIAPSAEIKNTAVAVQATLPPRENKPEPPPDPVLEAKPILPVRQLMLHSQEQPPAAATTILEKTEEPKQDTTPNPVPRNERQATPDNTPVPEMTKEGDLVPLDSVDVAPQVLRKVDPNYPPVAFRMGIDGTVVIKVLISETGDVVNTEILKMTERPFGFEKAALEALKKWKFQPARKHGVNVKVWKPLEIQFKRNPS